MTADKSALGELSSGGVLFVLSGALLWNIFLKLCMGLFPKHQAGIVFRSYFLGSTTANSVKPDERENRDRRQLNPRDMYA